MAILVGMALVALAASTALADHTANSRQEASLRLLSTDPGAASGLRFRVDYVDPSNPDGKPPSVRRVVTRLAEGARYDTSVPALCTAPDAVLILLGRAACPSASVVGVGEISLDTGLPGPLRHVAADITFLNNTDELIFLNRLRGSGARVVVRAEVRRRSVVAKAPFLPGALPDGAAIDTASLNEFEISRAGRNYITTPPDCPADGSWTNTTTFTYADGVTQTERTSSPCEG